MNKTIEILIYIFLVAVFIAAPIMWIFGDATLQVIGAALAALELLYFVFSFGTIKATEVGMLTYFDKPIRDLEKGLYFAPLGIYGVEKEIGTIFQDELPSDPERIYRGDGNTPAGMFPPIRVKFGQADPADILLQDDPYNVPMVAEVPVVVEWQITSLTTFRKQIGTVENARRMFADKATSVFGDRFANMTPAKAALGLAQISQELENKLKDELTDEGVSVRDAYVKPLIFSHELNTSVVNVSISGQKAKAYTLEQMAQINMARERLLNLGLLEPIVVGGKVTGYKQVVEINSATWAKALKNSGLQFLSLDPKGLDGVMAAILSAKGGNV